MILGWTLGGPFVTGSNLPAAVTAASWPLLLPTLELGRVVVVGRPDDELRHQLECLADEVVVVDEPVAAALLEGPADLVVVLDGRLASHLGLTELTATIATFRLLGLASRARWALGRRPDATSAPTMWLVPSSTPAAPPVPSAAAPATVALPFAPAGRWAGHAQLDRARRVARRLRTRIAAAPRRTSAESSATRAKGDPDRGMSSLAPAPAGGRRPPRSLLTIAPGASPARLPTWVLRIAEASGHDLAGRPWTVNAEGDYRSQKVWFRVEGADPSGADLIVKVTRDPAFSHRLHNEYEGLRLLEGHTTPGRIPAARFDAEHRGLAVVGESAVAGVAFSRRTDFTTDCPHFRSAVAWAQALVRERPAASPATGTTVAAGVLAPALGRLTSAFESICGPDAATSAMVRDDADRLCAAPLPAVFLHGDLGTWNMLVDEDGTIAVIDWENAEPEGLPCWDLAQLVTTHAGAVAAAAGSRVTPGTIIEALRPGTPWSGLLLDECRTMADALAFDPELTAPLVRLGWVLASVKAATRRDASSAGASMQARLLHALAHGAGTVVG